MAQSISNLYVPPKKTSLNTMPIRLSGSPASNALNSMAMGGVTTTPALTKPSTALKSTTVNADGSKTQTYHPENTTKSTSSNTGLMTPVTKNTATGGLTDAQKTAGEAFTNRVNTAPPVDSTSSTYQAPARQDTTYPGLISGLANTSVGGSQLGKDVTGQLINTAQGNQAIGQSAADIARQYGEEIARTGQAGANAAAGFLTGKGTSDVGGGNATIAANAASNRMSALSAAENAALAGTGQQLTAQQQIQSGLNQAGGLAYQGQGLVQSGLTSAGGLAAPQLGSYGSTYYNPQTAGQGNGAITPGSEMDTALNQYAQMAATGQISAVPANITSNPILNAELNRRAATINPAYNPVVSAAQGNVLASIPAMESANTAAKGIKGQIDSFLQNNPDINPSDLALSNSVQQWISGQQLTDPKYQTLFNYLNEYTNTLAPILGVGGSPTNLKTEIANSFINAKASGTSISKVLSDIEGLSDQKIKNLKSGALGGGVVSNNTVNTGGVITWDNII